MTTLESGSERLATALGELGAEAAELFADLLDGGAEMPFEVVSSDRGALPMFHYEPRTEGFIRGHTAELRRLDPYVEVRSRLGEEGAIGFLVKLFEGQAEFTLDTDRLERMVVEIASGDEPETSSLPGRVVVPLVGFRADAEEIKLDDFSIVRSDEAEQAPEEAIDAARGAREAWGPGFLALIPCAAGPEAAAAVVGSDLRRLLTTLRLYKPGGVGVHTHGWVRSGAGWAKFLTGGSRPRAGGYELSSSEAVGLPDFNRKMVERQGRSDALSWAIARFELGSERPTVIEALSDYLLALRGLLEGGGPARAALASRVAAVCAEAGERDGVRATVQRALAVERKLMSGAKFPASKDSPLRAVHEIEELLRAMLRDMATGELGLDLRATADEILVADGLKPEEGVPPAKVGETAEWRIPEPEIADQVKLQPDESEQPTRSIDPSEQETRIIACGVEVAGEMAERRELQSEDDDWFAKERPEQEPDWPAFASPRRDRRERAPDSARVRYLFPVPDDADWSVGELDYDRDSARVK